MTSFATSPSLLEINLPAQILCLMDTLHYEYIVHSIVYEYV